MTKSAVFTMKLEAELRDDFIAETDALHRPASQVMRELMRDFVERQREAREHRAFLELKIAAARQSIQAGDYVSHAEVEAEFAARRPEVTGRG